MCGLSKHTVKVVTHWVGADGTLYPYEEYMNWGTGKTRENKKDLPKNNYPYRYRYSRQYLFKCCQLCKCANKTPLTESESK